MLPSGFYFDGNTNCAAGALFGAAKRWCWEII